MNKDKQKTAYTVHPVSAELKKELTDKGYRILDAKFAGEGDEIFNKPDEEAPGKDEAKSNKKKS